MNNNSNKKINNNLNYALNLNTGNNNSDENSDNNKSIKLEFSSKEKDMANSDDNTIIYELIILLYFTN